MDDAVAVVLAAGLGTRMKSELPKVLIPVLGRPMIEYVSGEKSEPPPFSTAIESIG